MLYCLVTSLVISTSIIQSLSLLLIWLLLYFDFSILFWVVAVVAVTGSRIELLASMPLRWKTIRATLLHLACFKKLTLLSLIFWWYCSTTYYAIEGFTNISVPYYYVCITYYYLLCRYYLLLLCILLVLSPIWRASSCYGVGWGLLGSGSGLGFRFRPWGCVLCFEFERDLLFCHLVLLIGEETTFSQPAPQF
jgi:hypothetical protein